MTDLNPPWFTKWANGTWREVGRILGKSFLYFSRRAPTSDLVLRMQPCRGVTLFNPLAVYFPARRTAMQREGQS